MSGCGVRDYSSVMLWMVVVVCVRHILTVLLNSLSSAATHSSSNVGRSGSLRWTVSVASGAVCHGVDTLSNGRLVIQFL